MKFLPYDSFVIETPLQMGDAVARLRKHVVLSHFSPGCEPAMIFVGQLGTTVLSSSRRYIHSTHSYPSFTGN